MLKHVYLTIFFTFVIGFTAGVFGYFLVRDPLEYDGGVITENVGDFSITADLRGACEMVHECPSYYITEDGSYTYLSFSRIGGGQRYEGSLPKDDIDHLRELIAKTDLVKLSQTKRHACDETEDVYEYTIYVRGESDEAEHTYDIDSCNSDSESPLFEVLGDYYDIFSSRHDL